ncbi:DUF4822 domain-containing protein [Herminiimonas glaciei]|uniref:DUF4822 domain-containing protein n=1 Tax=Herminiimonas glaciei TaxID=523788 RepID=A0ABW2I8R3_9BURK
MKRLSIRALFLSLAAATVPVANAEPVAATSIDPKELSSKVWQTTAVYEENDRSHNVIERYPGVVGISIWDAASNRFEYFDPSTGQSRLSQGGAGYFFITGDKRYQINVFDGGGKALVRRLEILNRQEFTYSRVVPQNMTSGSREVRIYVVHTPYAGPFKIRFSEKHPTP